MTDMHGFDSLVNEFPLTLWTNEGLFNKTKQKKVARMSKGHICHVYVYLHSSVQSSTAGVDEASDHGVQDKRQDLNTE